MASLAEAAGRAAYGDGKHLQADPPGPLQPKPSAPKAAYRTRVHDIQNWLLRVRHEAHCYLARVADMD
jgi:hypothetical protein